MNAAIWGLLGTIAGALASIGTAWLAAHGTSQREREKQLSERVERTHAFQRQTLLELQDAIHNSLRLVHRAYLEDKRSQSQGNAWKDAVLSDSLDEELRVTNRQVAILIERVADDTLRSQLKRLMQVSTDALLAQSEHESSVKLEKVGAEAIQVLEAVGATLRSHYQ